MIYKATQARENHDQMIIPTEDLWDYCKLEQTRDFMAGGRCKPLGQYVPKDILLTKYKMSESNYKILMSGTKNLTPHEKTLRRNLTKRVYAWLSYFRVHRPKNFNRMSLEFILN